VRAMATNRYGSNEVLRLADLADPLVGPDSVLIRPKAVGVNPVDWKIVRGYLDRAFPSHFPLVPCWDVAGVVEAVGPAVIAFAPGQEVMAYNRQDHIQSGTLAELVSVPERCVAAKPGALGWLEAAALPLAGLTAFQCIHEALALVAGETVLIHGASGGVGSFAVQLGVRAGARVIGTASPGNHDYLRSLGAEPVEYGQRMPALVGALAPDGVDAVVDLVGGAALDASPRLLRSGGRLVGVTDARRVRELGGRYVFVRPDRAQLNELGELAVQGALTVKVSATFPFGRAVEAFDLVESGHTRGKVVIQVEDPVRP
jgi:NADPH:quinone reductase-like Zn-dependent oxidoreductase